MSQDVCFELPRISKLKIIIGLQEANGLVTIECIVHTLPLDYSGV